MSWLEDVTAETDARDWLYCRMIGGRSAGDVIAISSGMSVFNVPRDAVLPVQNSSGHPPLFRETFESYYRAEQRCQFEVCSWI